MKLIGLLLSTLLVLIQYPLWLGSGSWFRVWESDRLVSDQLARNAGLRLRNDGLEAEADDLRRGKLAIEERARYGLGMIRKDEIFVQFGPLPSGGDLPAHGNAGAVVRPGAERPARDLSRPGIAAVAAGRATTAGQRSGAPTQRLRANGAPRRSSTSLASG